MCTEYTYTMNSRDYICKHVKGGGERGKNSTISRLPGFAKAKNNYRYILSPTFTVPINCI